MKTKILKTLIIITILSLVIYVFSTFKNDKEKKQNSIKVTTLINMPIEDVFSYLGNSSNAKKWSVYVNHIETLNGIKVKDGTVGSTRRCFKNANKQGITWDEDILEVVNNKKRKLSIYNTKGFLISANGLMTEQNYESVDKNVTRLTFSLFYKNKKNDFITNVKTHFASYYISYIFESNLKNIKHNLENGKSK